MRDLISDSPLLAVITDSSCAEASPQSGRVFFFMVKGVHNEAIWNSQFSVRCLLGGDNRRTLAYMDFCPRNEEAKLTNSCQSERKAARSLE